MIPETKRVYTLKGVKKRTGKLKSKYSYSAIGKTTPSNIPIVELNGDGSMALNLQNIDTPITIISGVSCTVKYLLNGVEYTQSTSSEYSCIHIDIDKSKDYYVDIVLVNSKKLHFNYQLGSNTFKFKDATYNFTAQSSRKSNNLIEYTTGNPGVEYITNLSSNNYDGDLEKFPADGSISFKDCLLLYSYYNYGESYSAKGYDITDCYAYTTDGKTFYKPSFPSGISKTCVPNTGSRPIKFGDKIVIPLKTNYEYSKMLISEDHGKSFYLSSSLPSSREWLLYHFKAKDIFVLLPASSSSSTSAAYSKDLKTWTPVTLPTSMYSCMAHSELNGRLYVTINDSPNSYNYNKMIYTDDGINWKSYTMPATTNWGGSIYYLPKASKYLWMPHCQYNDDQPAYTNSETKYALISTDGLNWSNLTFPTSYPWKLTIIDDNPVFSTDGGTGWEVLIYNSSLTSYTRVTHDLPSDVKYYCKVGSTYYFWYSYLTASTSSNVEYYKTTSLTSWGSKKTSTHSQLKAEIGSATIYTMGHDTIITSKYAVGTSSTKIIRNGLEISNTYSRGLWYKTTTTSGATGISYSYDGTNWIDAPSQPSTTQCIGGVKDINNTPYLYPGKNTSYRIYYFGKINDMLNTYIKEVP
jgi:hypothetical protein